MVYSFESEGKNSEHIIPNAIWDGFFSKHHQQAVRLLSRSEGRIFAYGLDEITVFLDQGRPSYNTDELLRDTSTMDYCELIHRNNIRSTLAEIGIMLGENAPPSLRKAISDVIGDNVQPHRSVEIMRTIQSMTQEIGNYAKRAIRHSAQRNKFPPDGLLLNALIQFNRHENLALAEFLLTFCGGLVALTVHANLPIEFSTVATYMASQYSFTKIIKFIILPTQWRLSDFIPMLGPKARSYDFDSEIVKLVQLGLAQRLLADAGFQTAIHPPSATAESQPNISAPTPTLAPA